MTSISIFAGCGYRDTQISEVGPGANNSNASLDFAGVKARIFGVYCTRCHSQAGGNKAGINLETFANVSKNINLVKKAVNTSFMPPSRPLPSGDLNFLNAWIQAGAPENGAGGPVGEEPVPQPEECDDDDC